MRFADERERWGFGGRDLRSARTFETTIETTGPKMPSSTYPPDPPQDAETPTDAGASESGRGWFRTTVLSRVKRALSH